jgi:hypothetical protein
MASFERSILDLCADQTFEGGTSIVEQLSQATRLARSNSTPLSAVIAKLESRPAQESTQIVERLAVDGVGGYALVDALLALSDRNEPELFFRYWNLIVRSKKNSIKTPLYVNRHVIERMYFALDPKDRGASLNTSILQQAYGLPAPRDAKPPVLICAQPKSGSTYVSKVFATLTGRDHIGLHNLNGSDYVSVHAEFDWEKWRFILSRGLVVQCHLLPSLSLSFLIECYGIRPIILFRGLSSALRSKAIHGLGNRGDTVLERFTDIDTELSLKHSVYAHAFSYLNFVAEWEGYAKRFGYQYNYYEDNVLDWSAAFRKMSCYANLQFEEHEIEKAMHTVEQRTEENSAFTRVPDENKKRSVPFVNSEMEEFIEDLSRGFPNREKILT